jgi:hypothetical protein
VLDRLASTATGARDSAKEKMWMLCSLANTGGRLEISEQPHLITPTPGANSEDFDTDNWAFKTSAAYGIGVVHPKWLIVSTGDDVA